MTVRYRAIARRAATVRAVGTARAGNAPRVVARSAVPTPRVTG